MLAILPVNDLSSLGIETPRDVALFNECCVSTEWSPDDSVILVTPVDASALHAPQVYVDPASGAVSPVAWNTVSPSTWQRRAP